MIEGSVIDEWSYCSIAIVVVWKVVTQFGQNSALVHQAIQHLETC
jgi:hypothetical protein